MNPTQTNGLAMEHATMHVVEYTDPRPVSDILAGFQGGAMIAGIATHAELEKRKTVAVVFTNETINAVERVPTAEEMIAVNSYLRQYAAAFGHDPHGLHYLPMGEPETTAVWFPL